MKKRMLLHTLPLCFLLLFAGCTSIYPGITDNNSGYITDIPTPTPTFEEFATGIFLKEVTTDTISLRYSLSQPEHYGIADYPITLGSISDLITPEEEILTLYEQLLSYDKTFLNMEERKTYDALLHHLDLLLKDTSSPYLSELLGPTTGYQAQLPILLAEYRFDTVADVEHYLALLPCIYDYFKEIAAFEREKSMAGYFMNDATAKEIIAQCEEFVQHPDEHFLVTTFDERLKKLNLSASEEALYRMENQTALYTYVFPAYDLLTEALTSCLGTGRNDYGLYYFEGGREFYSLLASISTGSDKDIEELKFALSNAVQAGCHTMAMALAKEPDAYDKALHPTYPETDPELIIDYVTAKSAEDFPYINCGEYTIKYIPKSLEEFVSPAMYLVPPIDNYESGVIYVNGAERYRTDALFPTIIHEGYPGHLYQTISTLSGDIHPLRYLLSATGYEEGWATYVETYGYKYAGFSEALTSFLQADQIATLCLYALSDIYIHYDGYTPEQLSTFLADYGFPAESSNLIYQTLLSEPGAYLPYAVGYLEFMELQNFAKEAWGDAYSDYKFHEFLIETGPMPFNYLQSLLKK